MALLIINNPLSELNKQNVHQFNNYYIFCFLFTLLIV